MKIILGFLIFCTGMATYSQKTYSNKAFGFTVIMPDDWNKSFFNENESVNDAEKGYHQDSYYIANFTKTISWNKDAVNSRITVEASVNKQTGDFVAFKKTVEWSIENNIKPQYKNFSYKQKVAEITISGIKSLYSIFQYDFEMPNGTIAKVKNRMYIIPYKKYFFSIICIDGQDEKYDSSKDFEAIIAAIKVG